jgi:hypothetical protein
VAGCILYDGDRIPNHGHRANGKAGFTFVLHSRNAHIIAPTGSVIPVLTDPNTGFHWAVERIAARHTVEGKSRMIAAFLRHPNHAGVKLINTPVVPVNPFIEKKPSHPPTSFDLDRILQATSHFASLTTGENNDKLPKHENKGKLTKHVSFPVTRAQRSAERQIERDAENISDDGELLQRVMDLVLQGGRSGKHLKQMMHRVPISRPTTSWRLYSRRV